MIGQACRHGGGTFDPAVSPWQVQFDAQAGMRITEVVKGADQIGAVLQTLGRVQQTAPAPGDGTTAAAEGRIEAFQQSGEGAE